jgi:hypothetical protein
MGWWNTIANVSRHTADALTRSSTNVPPRNIFA